MINKFRILTNSNSLENGHGREPLTLVGNHLIYI